jgi:hypothetical protein
MSALNKFIIIVLGVVAVIGSILIVKNPGYHMFTSNMCACNYTEEMKAQKIAADCMCTTLTMYGLSVISITLFSLLSFCYLLADAFTSKQRTFSAEHQTMLIKSDDLFTKYFGNLSIPVKTFCLVLLLSASAYLAEKKLHSAIAFFIVWGLVILLLIFIYLRKNVRLEKQGVSGSYLQLKLIFDLVLTVTFLSVWLFAIFLIARGVSFN